MNNSLVEGRLSVNPRGFGFLETELDGRRSSLFVAPPDLEDFLLDDVVEARVVEGSDGRLRAESLSLVERPRAQLFGVVERRSGCPWLRVDRHVAITDWPLAGEVPRAGTSVIATIHGSQAEVVETVSAVDAGRTKVLLRWRIPDRFPAGCLEWARRARPRRATRRDLRDLPTLTIDAPHSLDLDDALSALPAQDDGAIRVFVSIADVDALAALGSPLDLEARRRGTSVYLPDRVIPMFPRDLSEGSMSLLEKAERPAMTVEMRIDPEGRVTACDLYESLIRTTARLDYESVADFFDEGSTDGIPATLGPTLRWLRTAAARLSIVRTARGGIKIFREETRLEVDDRGEPVALEIQSQNSAHLLVERLMVAANEAVAGWLHDRGLPALYRVHDEPEAEGIDRLSIVSRGFGFEPGFGPRLTPRHLAAFEEQIRTSGAAPALRNVIRRLLGPARYTVRPAPHFGLGAQLYLHFTSPIRRYADLTVHRIVKAHLHGDRNQEALDESLEDLAAELNAAADRASRAQNQRLRMLVARLLSDSIGERHRGNIVEVASFGLIVQLRGLGATGTIATESLPAGPYAIEPETESLVNRRGSRRYEVGQPLEVEISGTDENLGRVELRLVERSAKRRRRN